MNPLLGRGRHFVLVRAADSIHHRHRGDCRPGNPITSAQPVHGGFLILSGLMIGVFSGLDGILFYVFFEA